MISPFFYIVFSLTVTSAVLSLAFFMAWKNFGRRPHALTWSAAFLAGTLQWLSVMNADLFPSEQMFLLAENAFSTALVTLGLRGHCQRTHCKHLPQNLWPKSRSSSVGRVQLRGPGGTERSAGFPVRL